MDNATMPDEGKPPIEFSSEQLKAGVYITRVSGVITLVSSTFMVWRAWHRHSKMFNRLVLGMGTHLLIYSICNIIGPAVIPKDTTNASSNFGSIQTCTAQGLIIYVTVMTAVLYYCSFSFYSFQGTLHNFEKSSFDWMEKYIHTLVHIYPLITGLYIVYLKQFNNTGYGYCFLENDPIGCGNSPRAEFYVTCERGNDDHQKAQLIELFWDIPLYLEMIVPTVVMIVLYCKVRNRQATINIPSCSVAKQAVVYLGPLYLGVLPSAIVHTVEWFNFSLFEVPYKLALFSNIMFTLFALYSALTYLYFTLGGQSSEEFNESRHAHHCNDSFACSSEMIFKDCEKMETTELTTRPSLKSPEETPKSNLTTKHHRRISSGGKHSFNIFYGTNASGAYADFIFDGDSDDERTDNKETVQWSKVQDLQS